MHRQIKAVLCLSIVTAAIHQTVDLIRTLGMHHDGTKNDCPADGFIMSSSRGAAGETRWSRCSAAIMKELHKKKCLQDDGASRYDHSGFVGAPGRVYTAKRQCEVFLTDRDAHVVEDPGDVCANLKCKTPRRPGYYFAGPALDGTQCGGEKQCHAGDCIKSSNVNSRTVPDVWGRWKDDGRCKSGCIVKSRGFQTKRRKCSDAEENCYGPSSTKVLCKDTDICQQRISAIDYASERCKVFSGIFPNFDSKGIGLQSPHEKDRPWLGCAIFCRKRDGTYYAPVTELNDLEISSHFPDGTWCHRQNSENYYCLNHQCISENSKLLRTSSKDDIIQNAIPGGNIPDELVPYFSLDKNGEPFHLDFLRKRPKDEEWALDYILLPDS